MREFKITDGFPQKITFIDLGRGQRTICPREDELIAIGCKELIYTDKPEIGENQYLCEVYSENETEIIVNWEVKTIENHLMI